MGEHLVFFDHECPFCRRAIRHLIEIDRDKKFLFAPLNGETAKDILAGPNASLRKIGSLVLVENFTSTERRFSIRFKAISRIYWHIGHGWGLIGFFSFFPSCPFDWLYRQFAEHRHQFKLRIPDALRPKDRFLP